MIADHVGHADSKLLAYLFAFFLSLGAVIWLIHGLCSSSVTDPCSAKPKQTDLAAPFRLLVPSGHRAGLDAVAGCVRFQRTTVGG